MMKRFLTLLLISSFLLGLTVLAEGEDIKVMLDGEYIDFPHPPVIISGRVMVPLRGIFENFGATLSYDADVRVIKAAAGRKRVMMSTGVTQAVYENGAYKKNMRLDVPPTNVDGVTYVPVRFAAESFDMKVDWDAANKTVVVINLAPMWKRLKDGAPTIYDEFFDPAQMTEKSALSGNTKMKYTSYANDKNNPNSFGFDVETQGVADGKAEKKNSYVSIEAKGPAFKGVSIPANVNFTSILRGNQFYLRTDLWSSMNNLSIVKKFDPMWIKAGAEGSEQIPYYIMFGLNLKKFIDAYIKDPSFRVNIKSYNYLNSVIDGIIGVESTELTQGKENGAWVTLLDYKQEGITPMSAMKNSTGKTINVEMYAKKTDTRGEKVSNTFKLKLSIPDTFSFVYENTINSVVNMNVPDVEVVPESSIARYDDIADALQLAEVLIKIIK